jgi:hypothetical protein
MDASEFPRMDPREFNRNMMAHPPEELERYEDQHVAWSLDGKEILAHAPTIEELFQEIDRKGITKYVAGFIPRGDVSYF